MKYIFVIISFMFLTINNDLNKSIQWTATYYGNNYKKPKYTANGDMFNKNAMTCAAPKIYKFGTVLKITNLENDKSIVVRVNDRGANDLRGNTIDLTYGAFGKIANHKLGRIRIKIEKIRK